MNNVEEIITGPAKAAAEILGQQKKDSTKSLEGLAAATAAILGQREKSSTGDIESTGAGLTATTAAIHNQQENTAPSSITVTETKELKKAIDAHYDRIVITGPLAKKVKKAEKIKTLSPAKLAAIGALGGLAVAAVAAPGSGSVAFAAAAGTVSAATDLAIPVLFIIAFVGISAMSILFDDYTHFEVSDRKLVFERKKSESTNSHTEGDIET